PPKPLRRIVREAAEHLDDLRRATEAQSLTPAEVAVRTAEMLGNPEALAERHVEALRKTSWWGRHPVFGFVAIPLLVPILWMALSLALGCLVGFGIIGLRYGFSMSYDHTLLGAPILFFCGQCATWAGTATLAWFFCRKARNTVVPKRWLLAGCLLLSLQALIFTYHVTFNETAPYTNMSAILNIPYTLHSILGYPYHEPMSVANALLPWIIITGIYWRERRATKLMVAEFTS
ncbi:MAG TPA: hypothetical protein VK737_02955, partial [Opitutales bacterium]|nr:hypothetical protein [Opitutales bacterium]